MNSTVLRTVLHIDRVDLLSSSNRQNLNIHLCPEFLKARDNDDSLLRSGVRSTLRFTQFGGDLLFLGGFVFGAGAEQFKSSA